MTNFDYLYRNDPWALIDLLKCYSKGCNNCEFLRYGHFFGLCGGLHAEAATLDWLSYEFIGFPDDFYDQRL